MRKEGQREKHDTKQKQSPPSCPREEGVTKKCKKRKEKEGRT